MKKLHIVGGMPRSGSTLLCNVLNQNPLFYASSTSILAGALSAVQNIVSGNPTTKSYLIDNFDEAYERLEGAMTGLVEGWYSKHKEKVIFDKDREWNVNSKLLWGLYPDAKMIVVVRDLRAIAASIEKRITKKPLLTQFQSGKGKSQFNSLSEMFGPTGVVGNSLEGVEDLIRRKNDNVVFVKYESLVLNPKLAMQEIYSAIGEDYFEHDFNDVKDTAEDVDALYLGLWPHHNATGKIEQKETSDWAQVISPDVAKHVMGLSPMYNNYFGYSNAKQQ